MPWARRTSACDLRFLERKPRRAATGFASWMSAVIPPWKRTEGVVFTFQNDLIIMTFTGKQLKNLLEQQFKGADRPRLMGVSKGFSYTWDQARAVGDKIVPGSMKLNGVAVDPALQYRVTANSFLAGGSEGMSVFLEGTDRQVGLLDLEALVALISAASPYTPPYVGRLTRLN